MQGIWKATADRIVKLGPKLDDSNWTNGNSI